MNPIKTLKDSIVRMLTAVYRPACTCEECKARAREAYNAAYIEKVLGKSGANKAAIDAEAAARTAADPALSAPIDGVTAARDMDRPLFKFASGGAISVDPMKSVPLLTGEEFHAITRPNVERKPSPAIVNARIISTAEHEARLAEGLGLTKGDEEPREIALKFVVDTKDAEADIQRLRGQIEAALRRARKLEGAA